MNNIFNLQSGGAAPPFSYYQPVFTNNQSARYLARQRQAQQLKTTKTEKKEDAFDDKNMMQMLEKVNGLPNDMAQIFSQIQQFYKIKSAGLDEMDTSLLANQYLQTLYRIKVAAFNKHEYDNTYNQLVANNALNEKAITERGGLIAVDKDGKISEISVKKYKETPEDYELLSNSKLLQYRATSPDNAFKNDIFDITNNGIGMPVVNKLIQDAMKQIGTLESSENVVVQRKGSEMIQGIQALQQAAYNGDINPAAGVNGLYDVKTLTKTQTEQAKKAISYIYNMLPENAKTLLQLKSTDGEPKTHILQVITDFVNSNLDSTVSVERTLILDKDGEKPGSKSITKTTKTTDSNDDSEMNNDLFQNIIQGRGGTDSTFVLRDADGYTIETSGKAYPNLSVNANSPIPEQCSLQHMLTINGVSGILGSTHKYAITFGDQPLLSTDLQNIAYVNDAKAIRVWLPVKVNDKAGTSDRRLIPDFEFVKQHKDLVKMINQKGINHPDVQNYMQQLGLLNASGGLNTDIFHPYLVINGLGASHEITDDTYAQELTGKEKDRAKEIFLNSVFKDKGQEGKNYQYDFSDPWYGWGSDKLYKGQIFLPLTEDVLQGKTAAGTTIKQKHADILESDTQRASMQDNLKTTSANVLGL